MTKLNQRTFYGNGRGSRAVQGFKLRPVFTDAMVHTPHHRCIIVTGSPPSGLGLVVAAPLASPVPSRLARPVPASASPLPRVALLAPAMMFAPFKLVLISLSLALPSPVETKGKKREKEKNGLMGNTCRAPPSPCCTLHLPGHCSHIPTGYGPRFPSRTFHFLVYLLWPLCELM